MYKKQTIQNEDFIFNHLTYRIYYYGNNCHIINMTGGPRHSYNGINTQLSQVETTLVVILYIQKGGLTPGPNDLLYRIHCMVALIYVLL